MNALRYLDKNCCWSSHNLLRILFQGVLAWVLPSFKISDQETHITHDSSWWIHIISSIQFEYNTI